MDTFIGFVALGDVIEGLVQSRNGSNVPTAADGSVAFRVYGPDGLMTNGTGTGSLKDSGNRTGLYKVQVTASSGNGYESGQNYQISVNWAVSSSAKAATLTFTVL